MTKYQKLMVGLSATIVAVLIVIGGLLIHSRISPSVREEVASGQASREEQLAKACEAHPVDCEKMRMVHAMTAAKRREAQQYGPSLAPAIAELQKTQDEYDDRFIAYGYYGDERAPN